MERETGAGGDNPSRVHRINVAQNQNQFMNPSMNQQNQSNPSMNQQNPSMNQQLGGDYFPIGYTKFDFDSYSYDPSFDTYPYVSVSPDGLNFSGLSLSEPPTPFPNRSPLNVGYSNGASNGAAYRPYDPYIPLRDNIRVNSGSYGLNQNQIHGYNGFNQNATFQDYFNPNLYSDFDPYSSGSGSSSGSGIRSLRYSMPSRNNNNPTRILVPDNSFYDYMNGSLSSSSTSQNGGGYRSRWFGSVSSLEELRGKMVVVAEDQCGVKLLQKKIVEGNRDDLDMIFLEVKDHIRELMMHQFGHHLIQKFCEFFDEKQMNELVLLVLGDDRAFMSICLDVNGTRVIQKIIEHITTAEQRSRVASALKRITLPLTKNMNGHHVIRHCLKYFPIEDKMQILNVVADNFIDIAIDKSGCVVLQQCVAEARGETLARLIGQIIAEAATLSEDPYGNYVVQYLLMQRIRLATEGILRHLFGHFVYLSTNKYGSNVVEKCLRETSPDLAMKVIQELISYPQEFLTVVQNPYGNYVAQTALSAAKGGLRHRMIELIQSNYANLHSHPHGKRVLARTRAHNRYQHHRM